MNPGARTPEELDTLFEDAFVVRDRAQLCALFERAGVLAPAPGWDESRGAAAIGRTAAELWSRDHTYVAGPRRVLQARDTALIVSDDGMHVARRGEDGAWRVAICLLGVHNPITEEDA